MSIRVMNQVWERSRQSGAALLVLLAIADHCDDAGRAFPGIDSLAAKARLTDRGVQKLLHKLEGSGELVIGHGQGPHGTHLYHVQPPEGVNAVQGNGGERCSGVNGVRGERGCSPGVNVGAQGGEQAVHPNRHRTVSEPSVPGCAADAAPRREKETRSKRGETRKTTAPPKYALFERFLREQGVTVPLSSADKRAIREHSESPEVLADAYATLDQWGSPWLKDHPKVDRVCADFAVYLRWKSGAQASSAQQNGLAGLARYGRGARNAVEAV